jgi:leader peptidase (prepilin peptidase)/N-methyltransferase
MPQSILIIYSALLGLCFGSFANSLIYRWPRNESIVTPPSHCPACKHRLEARDLIPVVSWLLLKARCGYCKERISARYPLVEAVCALLFACAAWQAAAWPDIIPLCVLVFALLTVSVIDWDTQEIPDGLLITGATAGILWVAASHFFSGLNAPGVIDALLGAGAGALPLFLLDRLVLLLIKKDGFGFGDVKLMAVAGLFLGWQMVLVSFFLAFIAGGMYAAFLLFSGRSKRGTYMPFGPFLAAGVLAALWWGEKIAVLVTGMWV